MKTVLLHSPFFILYCFLKTSVAQITGSFPPIELEQAIKGNDAIYTLNIIEAKAHHYSYKGKQYLCGIEYKAELLDVLKGNGEAGGIIEFSTWVPLTVQRQYLIFLNDLSQPVELPKGAKHVKGFKVGRLNRVVGSKEDEQCDKRLPLLRTDFERNIFEFDKDLEFKTKELWLRYTPVRASIVLPDTIKQAPIAKQCGELLVKDCLFNEVAVRWEDLCKAIMGVVGQ